MSRPAGALIRSVLVGALVGEPSKAWPAGPVVANGAEVTDRDMTPG